MHECCGNSTMKKSRPKRLRRNYGKVERIFWEFLENSKFPQKASGSRKKLSEVVWFVLNPVSIIKITPKLTNLHHANEYPNAIQ